MFVDNKLSIHFGEGKTKSFFLQVNGEQRHKYKGISKKQHSEVTYLGCVLDETVSGESMALKFIKKINSKLKLLHRKNRFLSLERQRMICNALIQPHLDYACSACYPNLTTKTRKTMQVR